MFILGLRLKTTKYDNDVINKRFGITGHVHNTIAKHALSLLEDLTQDEDYIKLKKQYKNLKETLEEEEFETASRSVTKDMNTIIHSYGLTKNDLEKYAKVQARLFRKNLSSQQIQKEADRVYTGVEKVLYGDGKKLHLKKYKDINTISSKSPMNGVKLYSPFHKNYLNKKELRSVKYETQINWNGLAIRVDADYSDRYVYEAMQHEVSYCEIKRMLFMDGYHYYVIIYFKGEAPKKLTPGTSDIEIDPGVSTLAVYSEEKLLLEELAPKAKDYQKQIRKLQTQVDNCKRRLNPENYNPDGTVKIRIRNGAAIFRNRAGNTVASAYPDIYLMTSDPKHEISERMFNGGFHRWSIKDNVSAKAFDDDFRVVTYDNGSYYGSNPTKTDYTGYLVLFSGNKCAGINSDEIPDTDYSKTYVVPVKDYLGYGGAIGVNGVLEIGDAGESVVMLKHWKSDAEAIRPSYADFLNNWVTLKRDGEAYTGFGKFTLSHTVTDPENNTETAYLNVENDRFVLAEVLYNKTAKTWRITIDGLPVLPDVQKAWSIEEKTSAGEGYKGTPVTPPGTGIDYEITNEAVITISGKKVWKNDTEADRPESGVTIHLYQEGVEQEIGHTTAQAPDWTWSFTDLPKYDNNEEEIQYIIEESAVDNYGQVERIREEDGTWTITNTHTEGQTILEVRKAWEDNEHYKDMFRPESVTVQLLRFDRETETWVEVPDAVLTLNHGNAWEGIFEYLPEYEEIGGRPVRIQYSVAEIDAPEGYTVTGPFGDMTDGFEITNTEITTVEVPVRKVWSDPNSEHAAVTVILDPAGAELTLSEENGWAGTFTDLPKYDRDGMLIPYSVRELRVPGYRTEIRFDRETGGFLITNNKEKPKGPQFFVFELPELPKTGFSAVRPTALAEQPLNLRYALSGMTLEIPSLDVSADIVEVPYANNEYAIDWLDERVGLLEGTMVPGEGISILTGHNHLNTMEAGPFAFLKFMNEGDMIFVRDRAGELQSFRVYAAEKIGAADTAKLVRIAMQDENSITLMTCEDELPDGGYASRRVVAARPAGK